LGRRGTAKPPFGPLHDRNSIWLEEIRFETGPDDLGLRFEPVEIEMIERKAASRIFVDQGEGGGMHVLRDVQAAG